MFPNFYHDQSPDFVSRISSNDPHQEDIVQVQDLMQGHEDLPRGSNLSHNTKILGKGKQQQHMIIASKDNYEANPSTDHVNCERKIVRRDNERQRRQLMAVLNATLRSFLPHELIKVKINLYIYSPLSHD